ncbi:MAG: hypothetical protein V4487_08125 [Chlamydiota bacterium]
MIPVRSTTPSLIQEYKEPEDLNEVADDWENEIPEDWEDDQLHAVEDSAPASLSQNKSGPVPRPPSITEKITMLNAQVAARALHEKFDIALARKNVSELNNFLCLAIREGNLKGVQLAIEKNIDVNSPHNSSGVPPLVLAFESLTTTHWGHVFHLNPLLVEVYASIQKDTRESEKILQKEFSLHTKLSTGRLLGRLINDGKLKNCYGRVISLLATEKGLFVNFLDSLAQDKAQQIILILLKANANPTSCKYRDYPLLLLACGFPNGNHLVSALLNNGADATELHRPIEAPSGTADTPFHLVAQMTPIPMDIANSLLKAGASPSWDDLSLVLNQLIKSITQSNVHKALRKIQKQSDLTPSPYWSLLESSEQAMWNWALAFRVALCDSKNIKETKELDGIICDIYARYIISGHGEIEKTLTMEFPQPLAQIITEYLFHVEPILTGVVARLAKELFRELYTLTTFFFNEVSANARRLES